MLYDTFGFPLEITQEVAAERGVEVDQSGFEQAMEAQRAMSQAAAVSIDVTADSVFAEVRCGRGCRPTVTTHVSHTACAPQIADSVGETAFAGYTALSTQATVRALFVDGKSASFAHDGQSVAVVLDSSPFYAESGGQVGDHGLLHVSDGAGQLSVDVSDVQKVGGGRLFLHSGKVVGEGELRVGALVTAAVDPTLRRRVRARALRTGLLARSLAQSAALTLHLPGPLQPYCDALAASCTQAGHGRRHLAGWLACGFRAPAL